MNHHIAKFDAVCDTVPRGRKPLAKHRIDWPAIVAVSLWAGLWVVLIVGLASRPFGG